MIVVVDVIMLWPVVTRGSGRGQRELRELSSRADWYYYHHHFPELRIQSPKSPKDNHLYLGQKINVVCTLINFVLVYVGCLWHVGFNLMLKGEIPQKNFLNLDGPKVEQKQFAWRMKKAYPSTRKASHLGCSESYSFLEYKPYTQLHRDGAHHSQGREQMHSVLERLTPSLRQMNYQNFMRTLILFFSVHNFWTMEKLWNRF